MRLICTCNLAKMVWPYKKSYKLASLANDLQISVVNQHRAMDDVNTMVELFNILNARFDNTYNRIY